MIDSGRTEAIILVSGPDQPGLVAEVTGGLHEVGANILDASQHTDRASQIFLQRLHLSWPRGDSDPELVHQVMERLSRKRQMRWKLRWGGRPRRVGIFVSKLDHCLHDLLALRRDGTLNCHINVIISNHPDLADVADSFGVPFHYLPVQTSGDPAAEARQIDLLTSHNVELVVLARYMRVLSPTFISQFQDQIINIHHSFLPAFAGARPYQQAHEKGVKLIGATAHYATATLDAGPIIEQDVTRVSHRDSVLDFVRKGRDLERTVLARAVRWHLEDRVVVLGSRAIVFE